MTEDPDHPLYPHLPTSREAALTAAEVADRAGENRRSAGTKLSALSLRDNRVRSFYDQTRRQNLWWRTEA